MASAEHGSEQARQAVDVRLVVDTIPTLAWSARSDGSADFFNQRWLDYTGLAVDQARDWGWTAALHADDLNGIVDYWRSVLASAEPGEIEGRLRRFDGEYRWFLFRASPLRDESGKVVKWFGTNTDITERKAAEETIRRQEAELRQMLDLAPQLVAVFGPNRERIHVNRVALDYLGVSLEEWRLTPEPGAFVHPDDRARDRDYFERALSAGSAYELELRLRKGDGTYRWFLARLNPVRNDQGQVIRWYVACTDIEDRKRAEDALRANEQSLRLIVESVPGLVNTTTADGEIEFANQQLLDYFGKSLEELKNWQAVVHADDLARVIDLWNHCVKTGQPYDDEHRIRRADGVYRWFQVRGRPLRDNEDRIVRWYILLTDIEERKHAEEKLRLSETYLAEAQRLSRTGSFGCKLSTNEMIWSEETFRIFGYDRATQPAVEHILQRVHPEDKAMVQEQIDRATREGKDCDLEYRLMLPDHSVKHVHVVARVRRDEAAPVEIAGAVMDITERKLAEEVLRQSEERFRLVLDSIGAHVIATDLEGELEFVNQPSLDYFGKTLEELKRWQTSGDVLHPDDLASAIAVWRDSVEKGVSYDVDHRFRRSDGVYRWFHVRGRPQRDAQGSIVRWYALLTDIDERKLAEEKVRQQEKNLRSSQAYLAEAQKLSHTGSWAWSPEQDIRYWSEECYRVLGFDPQRGLPRKEEYYQRIHPDDQPGFMELIGAAIRDKTDWEADYRIVHPDGPVRDIHVVGHPVLSTSGRLVEFVGTVIDVTERKRAEEELRRSEMELRQILDLTPQLIAVFGPHRERLFINRMALDYFGLTLEEWRNTAHGAVGHPDDSKRVQAQWDRVMSSGPAFEMEVRMRKRDGNYRWFLARYNPVFDDEGHILRWYAASTDIDDRKRAEERLIEENVALREEIDKASMFEEIVGTSPALQTVLSRISKVAPTDSTVLISGETGTGKELVARAIHRRSHRDSRAFVSVNCAAIPRDLIASELFGHEKGAFTGALQRRIGRFELAEGGTIFLDEVGELSADTQVALLRVLQEREFERIGGRQPIRVDVRVIAATNRDLKAAVANGTFRQDLYYRLNVFPLEVPPLRERRKDIPLLVRYFIDRYARKAGRNIRSVDKKTLELLESYPWPGNIRELQNVIERSVIVSETEKFSVDESWLSQQPRDMRSGGTLHLSQRLAAQEKEIIEEALRESQGRVFGPSGAAAKLGIARSTLEMKIRSLNINKNRFKAGPGRGKTSR